MRVTFTLLITAGLCVSRVPAQDAGSVLSEMVQTTTLRNTSKLPDAEMAKVDRLTASARSAGEQKNYAEATKDYSEAMSLLRNEPWTPERAWDRSISVKPDHSIVEPGQVVTLKVFQTFTPDAPLTERPFVFIYLVPFLKDRPRLLMKTMDRLNPNVGAAPLTIPVTIPNVANGPQRIVVNFENVGEKSVAVNVQRGVMANVAALHSRLDKLASKRPPELASVEGYLAAIEAADRGERGDRIDKMDFSFELGQATLMIGEMEAGLNPYRNRYGDVRKSYRSAVDNTLQPYRLYVPSTYTGARPYPLIVLLHGMGGNQNSMFDAYGNGAFAKLAEKHGYFVVCPRGRGPADMYRDAAERDVLDALADVQRAYKIDPNRIYMAGHSMGAYGTWSIAMDHPDLFAALALISGGGDPSQVSKIAKIPQLVIHGDADSTVPVANSRAMVEADKKAGADVKYIEIPGGNHVDVAVPAFEPIFEWFDAHSK